MRTRSLAVAWTAPGAQGKLSIAMAPVAMGFLDGGTEQALVCGEDLRAAVTHLLQKRVDPSISVKRKVTVPVDRLDMRGLLGRLRPWAA